ncbi:MAG: PRC-barrel domain-containing protein [Bacteroidota bacterium]
MFAAIFGGTFEAENDYSMPQYVFSLRDMLGVEIVTTQGYPLGCLQDIVVDQEQARLGYFVVSTTGMGLRHERNYAIHHSYFRSDGVGLKLVFDIQYGLTAKRLGRPNLPEHYSAKTIGDLMSFEREVVRQVCAPSHRSDN